MERLTLQPPMDRAEARRTVDHTRGSTRRGGDAPTEASRSVEPPQPMRRSRRAAIAATLGSQWGRYLLQIVSLVVLARLLTPTDFGMVASVTAITGIAAVIGDFGLSLAAMQARELSQQQRSNFWWANLAIGCSTGAVIAALGQPISGFYGRPELAAVCAALAVVFPLSGAAVQYSVELVRSGRLVPLAVVEVCAAAVGLGLAIGTGAAGAGYWAVVVQQVATASVALLLLVAVVRWRPSLPRRRAGMRRFFSFGRDTAGLQVINYISSNLDSVLIGRFFGQAVLGLYNRAFQIVGVPVQQVVGPMTRIVLPSLSAKTVREEFDAAVLSLQRMTVLVLLAPLSLCAAVAAPMLVIVLGPRWEGATLLLQVLAVGGAFQAIGFIYYWAFLAKGATRALFMSELWGRILSIVLMVVVAPLGPVLIAGAAALGQLVIWGCSALIYARRIGLDAGPLVRAALPLLVAFGVSGGAGAVAAAGSGPVLVLQALAAAATWTVVSALLIGLVAPVRTAVLGGARDLAGFLRSRR